MDFEANFGCLVLLIAVVYGRIGGGIPKKKFRLIDLWECKLSDNADDIPDVINSMASQKYVCSSVCPLTVVPGSIPFVYEYSTAFYFFSPLKSFILLADSEEEKLSWTTSIRDSINRTLRGRTSMRRASVRSDLLLDEEDMSTDYELETAFVIKNGWLNVTTEDAKRTRRLWISLTLQTLSLSAAFKAALPDESINIECCEAIPLKEDTCFRVHVVPDRNVRALY